MNDSIDLVLFDVAGAKFGADLAQVARIDNPHSLTLVRSQLGTPRQGHRAIVFTASNGDEVGVPVDVVRGVAAVPLAELRRLPASASTPFAIGAWVKGDKTVLLIDLHALAELPERKGAAP
ncbi:MAG: chemotaxis protein CheW [Archangium sp.]|nr:chemotaxis protein CheW [Archangium sp.]